MKSKVHKEAVTALTTAVFIGKITNKFTEKDIAKSYGLTDSTMRRYLDPEAREATRRAAQAQTSRERYRRLHEYGTCSCCQKPLADHARCVMCDILIHDSTTPIPKRHRWVKETIAENGLCKSCARKAGYPQRDGDGGINML